MPRLIRRHWEADPTLAGIRDAAVGFDYEAYVPDPIQHLDFAAPLSLVAELEATSLALADLQGHAGFTGLEAISRQLLRAESIGSSRIEGLQLSQRRLARALLDPASANETVLPVLGNVQAMDAAIRLGSSGDFLQPSDVLALHRRLLERTRDSAIAGHVRTTQNWIGGPTWGPRNAEFIPPPETELVSLLDDLCAFMARTDLPATLQAAIAHAQFETIHPFADGTGRVGRALIHVVLRRRGLTPAVVPPVSLVLATNAQRYVDGLTLYRAGDINGWCLFFVRCLRAATVHARDLNEQLVALRDQWLQAAHHPRRDSATARLIHALPGQPVVDLRTAATILGSSDESARRALNELEAAGILHPLLAGKKKNRIWEAKHLLMLLDNFEWSGRIVNNPG